MCEDKTVSVFVYGTLKVGGRLNSGEQLAVIEGDEVDGTLYYHPYVGFPMGILDNSGGSIKGEVHIYPEDYIQILDLIEQEGRMYKRRKVITKGGRPSYFYEWAGDTSTLLEVEGGEWRND